jgi:hypothetical protein
MGISLLIPDAGNPVRALFQIKTIVAWKWAANPLFELVMANQLFLSFRRIS